MTVRHASNTSRQWPKLAVAALAVASISALGSASPAGADSAAAQMPETSARCDLVLFDFVPYYECKVEYSGVVSLSEFPGDVRNLPVVITATGTPGGDGSPTWRTGGDGGKARTVVDGSDLGDEFYAYTGRRGSPPPESLLGGQATVMSSKPIEQVTDVDDVFVIAGGGGAIGYHRVVFGDPSCGGGSGGSGGIADAATSQVDVTGSGDRPQGGRHCDFWNGQRPDAGHDGIGGVQPGNPSTNGRDGIGGVGGGTHWYGERGGALPAGYAGAGGHSTAWASGGGGYGGGGAGERNWGGAGGGSFATAATAEPLSWDLVGEPLQRSQAEPVLTLTYPWTP